MELMNIKIVKDVRNLANRLTNCENANIDKTVTAAAAQTEAIRRIQSGGGSIPLRRSCGSWPSFGWKIRSCPCGNWASCWIRP